MASENTKRKDGGSAMNNDSQQGGKGNSNSGNFSNDPDKASEAGQKGGSR